MSTPTSTFDYSQLRQFGDDVYISSNVEIKRPHLLSVGNHVAIDSGFYCTVNAIIGDYIHIGPYVSIIGGEKGWIRMAAFSSMAGGCRVICSGDEHLGHGLPGPTIPPACRDRLITGEVIFEQFANVATNVVIYPGVTLREGCVIGACSLVTKDTEPWTIYKGIPARPFKSRERDRMLKFACSLGYSQVNHES